MQSNSYSQKHFCILCQPQQTDVTTNDQSISQHYTPFFFPLSNRGAFSVGEAAGSSKPNSLDFHTQVSLLGDEVWNPLQLSCFLQALNYQNRKGVIHHTTISPFIFCPVPAAIQARSSSYTPLAERKERWPAMGEAAGSKHPNSESIRDSICNICPLHVTVLVSH